MRGLAGPRGSASCQPRGHHWSGSHARPLRSPGTRPSGGRSCASRLPPGSPVPRAGLPWCWLRDGFCQVRLRKGRAGQASGKDSRVQGAWVHADVGRGGPPGAAGSPQVGDEPVGSTPRTHRPPPNCAHVTVPKAHSGGDGVGSKDPPELSPFPGNTGHPGWDCGAALGSSGLEWKLPVPGVLTRERVLESIHQGGLVLWRGLSPGWAGQG